MLIEGLVGVVALIAAASLPSDLYYDINVDHRQGARSTSSKLERAVRRATASTAARRRTRCTRPASRSSQHLDLGEVEEMVGGESLRGRTGGAVTLAVGMALIFTEAFDWVGVHRRLAA